jgi:hypothetical protein
MGKHEFQAGNTTFEVRRQQFPQRVLDMLVPTEFGVQGSGRMWLFLA